MFSINEFLSIIKGRFINLDNNDKNYFVFGGMILSFFKFNYPVVANRANFA